MVPLVRYAGYCAGEALIVTANVGKLVLKLSIASKTDTEVWTVNAVSCRTLNLTMCLGEPGRVAVLCYAPTATGQVQHQSQSFKFWID